MEHYKSWAGLKKQLSEALCDTLKNRITYFLTRYHTVHNSYGRAAILLDGKELVCFSWVDMYQQEQDITPLYDEIPGSAYAELVEKMKPKWDKKGTYSEMDFLDAVLRFRNLSIEAALEHENFIVKILAILDRRVGRRRLSKILAEEAFKEYPAWVRQFYDLRLLELDQMQRKKRQQRIPPF